MNISSQLIIKLIPRRHVHTLVILHLYWEEHLYEWIIITMLCFSGVLNKFDPSTHPANKKMTRGNKVWCKDVFDIFAAKGEDVALGDVVQRSYAPVQANQKELVINFYNCPRTDVQYIDEHDVMKCATLRIELPQNSPIALQPVIRRELRISMMFGDTEIKMDCIDVTTGSRANARADFFS